MTAPLPPREEEEVETPSRVFPLRQAVVFGSIVSAILLFANAVVCGTLGYFLRVGGWPVWQVGPGAVALAFIPATILRFRSANGVLRIVYALSAGWLGVLNFAFFAAVGCWVVEAIVAMTGWPLPRFWIAAVLFSVALVAAIYGLINARVLRTSRVTVKLPNLPEAWRGRTAALVTDLHLGPLSGAGFLRRVIARLRGLQPDAVLISGDMFDGPTLGLDEMVAPWREFSAPRGIFFVTGNHDEFEARRLYLEPVERVGIRVLNNEKASVAGLQIIGVHDAEAGDPAELRAVLQRAKIDRTRASVLLAHRPINLSVAEVEGVSLQLSGHTHGGQVWPWNWLVSRIYGRFGHGLARFGELQVYTSYGVGTWGPPCAGGDESGNCADSV